jgi:ABC-type proline/glycine betaine transport system ATPase subunit
MAEAKKEREIFTLRYHKQTAQTVTFYATDLDDAIRIGRKYCEESRLRFIHVGPFAVDLEEILRKKEQGA